MALRAAYALLPDSEQGKRVGLTIPLWQADLLRLAEEISEGCDIDDTGMYTILRWEKMLGALMKLQAQCRPLPDGEIVVSVDGETLRIAVKDGVPSVSDCRGGAPAARALDHLQAMRYFLSPYTALRNGDFLAQCWFPLPICLMGVDTV